jgi:hypothetical protein
MMTNWKTELAESNIPPYMHGGIVRWIENAIPPGSFLTAVLCNDLREACACADDANRYLLFEYVKWLHNHAPCECWGSSESFNTWHGTRAAITQNGPV